jgi:hypothetical protein
MSIERCKASLLGLLSDPSNRVIALAGKWGTGKSHLWREIREAATEDSVRKAPYVSLFGVSTITELQLRIVQECIPYMDSSLSRTVTDYGRSAKKLLMAVSNRFSALDDIALLVAPKLLRDRFVVIDDIERKHAQLSIDEVLGFIDDLIQNRNCRVLLILNADKLGDKALWDQLREKVIDHELLLDTSAGEAFDIARKTIPTNFVPEIRSAVEICKISNIRVICKILRVVNRVLADYQKVSPEVAARIIPSSVLLSGIYYKGVEDGPPIEFVLGLNADVEAMLAEMKSRAKDRPTEEDKLKARWKVLLQQLHINSVDEFEELVVEFLRSGLLDDSALRNIVTRYFAEAGELLARQRVDQFFHRCHWHPELSEAALVEEARAFIADIRFLNAFTVTSLYDRLIAMVGGQAAADDIVASWIDNFRRSARVKDWGRADEFNLFGRRLHPLIKAEFDTIYAGQRAKTTLLDVCREIVEKSGWGKDEEAVMRSSSPADFATMLTSLTGEDLKLFLLKNLDFYANRATYQQQFGSAMNNFLTACRTICANNANPRLTALIRNVFADSKLIADLEPHTGKNQGPA